MKVKRNKREGFKIITPFENMDIFILYGGPNTGKSYFKDFLIDRHQTSSFGPLASFNIRKFLSYDGIPTYLEDVDGILIIDDVDSMDSINKIDIFLSDEDYYRGIIFIASHERLLNYLINRLETIFINTSILDIGERKWYHGGNK